MIDPAMVGTLMGALSALSKTRALAPRPAATTPAASTSAAPDSKSPGGPSGDDAEGETLDGTGDSQDREASIEDAVESGEPRAPKETTSPPEVPASPEAAPQSPLQQILGIDPDYHTALNVLADHEGTERSPDRESRNRAEKTCSSTGVVGARDGSYRHAGRKDSGHTQIEETAQRTALPQARSRHLPQETGGCVQVASPNHSRRDLTRTSSGLTLYNGHIS